MKVVTLNRYVGFNAFKKSLQRIVVLVLLMLMVWGRVEAQNAIAGAGFTAGWPSACLGHPGPP